MLDNDTVKNYYREIENYDWTQAADNFIGPETLLHRCREKEVVKLIESFGREKYIDIGCGTGLISRHLPSASVGVDLNPRNLEKARAHAPQIDLRLADIEKTLPFPDGHFQTAICTEVLEHLLQPEAALAEIERVLSPGGYLIGSVPGNSLIWMFRHLSFSRRHFAAEPYHKHRSKREAIALLRPFFEIVKIYGWPGRMNWFFVAKKI